MILLEGTDPVPRHPRDLFDYGRLLDGRTWKLEGADLNGKTPRQAWETIRHAARRQGKRIVWEYIDNGLIVRAVER